MHKGELYIVATPIGNMSDLTFRAREILQQVDCIAVEDSRQSGKLLKHYAIHTATISLFEHNEEKQIPKILARLDQGQDIALISDAGTPLISDPGYLLVQAAQHANFAVYSIPGASSLTAALSISGIPVNRFVFEGFLPTKSHARGLRLQTLATEERSLVFFEAPHRILHFLKDCAQVLGSNRHAAVARELTKIHESLHKGTLADLIEVFQNKSVCKGEMVVIIEGVQIEVSERDHRRALEIARLLHKELPVKKAAALTAQITGVSRNSLYQQLIKEKNQP